MRIRSYLPIVAASFVAGMLAVALTTRISTTRAADGAPVASDDLAALKAEVARLKGVVSDQSHAMADVAYHYANLWFAAQADNWPLAQFYFDETRSHLRWAVRVIPKRKDREGREVDLKAILDAFEQSSLKELDQAVKAKDKPRFTAAYKQQLENCMACHRASAKEYIRLHVPDHPDASIIDFHADTQPAGGPKG